MNSRFVSYTRYAGHESLGKSFEKTPALCKPGLCKPHHGPMLFSCMMPSAHHSFWAARSSVNLAHLQCTSAWNNELTRAWRLFSRHFQFPLASLLESTLCCDLPIKMKLTWLPRIRIKDLILDC